MNDDKLINFKKLNLLDLKIITVKSQEKNKYLHKTFTLSNRVTYSLKGTT